MNTAFSSSPSSNGQTTSFVVCVPFARSCKDPTICTSNFLIFADSLFSKFSRIRGWPGKASRVHSPSHRKNVQGKHWYLCHDCGLDNGQGVCVVCCNVCHKGHHVTYAKYSGFYCDCGARGNTYCKVCYRIISTNYLHTIIYNVSQTHREQFPVVYMNYAFVLRY